MISDGILKDLIDLDGILKDSIDFAPDPYGSHRFSMGFVRIPLILHRNPKDPIVFGWDS